MSAGGAGTPTKRINLALQRGPAHYKRMNIHVVEADEQLKPLGASSKLNAERTFLQHLKTIGRAACERWLARNFDHISVSSTVDLVETYL